MFEDIEAIVAAYFMASIPSTFLLGRMAGVDLRNEGSHNVGAGNLTRLAGLRWGVPAAAFDALKGLGPVLIARQIGLPLGVVIAIGIAAIAGHNWPIFSGFRGGRGLATSAGVVLGIDPLLILWPLAWAIAGWRVGGGLGGFVGWVPLGIVTDWLDRPQLVVSGVFAIGMLAVVRRIQGNPNRLPGLKPALYRAVFDSEPVVAAREPILS